MINVIKFTFKELTKNKAYKLTTLFLVALIVIFFNIPNISRYFNKNEGNKPKTTEKETIYIYDENKVLNIIKEDLNKHQYYKFVILNEKADINKLSKDVNDKNSIVYIVKNADLKNLTIANLKSNNNRLSFENSDINQYINSSYKRYLINKLNINDNEKEILSKDISFISEETVKELVI